MQARFIARFIQRSRQHFELVSPTRTAIHPPKQKMHAYRQVLRSLLVAGSLGAAFGGTAWAGEASTLRPDAETNSLSVTNEAERDTQPDNSLNAIPPANIAN